MCLSVHGGDGLSLLQEPGGTEGVVRSEHRKCHSNVWQSERCREGGYLSRYALSLKIFDNLR